MKHESGLTKVPTLGTEFIVRQTIPQCDTLAISLIRASIAWNLRPQEAGTYLHVSPVGDTKVPCAPRKGSGLCTSLREPRLSLLTGKDYLKKIVLRPIHRCFEKYQMPLTLEWLVLVCSSLCSHSAKKQNVRHQGVPLITHPSQTADYWFVDGRADGIRNSPVPMAIRA